MYNELLYVLIIQGERMKTKDKIMESSFSLFLENGIQGTSTKHILDASGVSNGTLYHYFSSKEKIVEQIFYSIQDEMINSLHATTKDAVQFREFLWLSWETLIRYALENAKKHLFIKMFKDSSIMRNCKENMELLGYNFYSNSNEAIEKEIIDVPSSDYLIIIFNANIDGVIEYFQKMKIGYDGELIKSLFNKFWRSVARY